MEKDSVECGNLNYRLYVYVGQEVDVYYVVDIEENLLLEFGVKRFLMFMFISVWKSYIG